MASDNLNRAFIKAYDKGKLAGTHLPKAAEAPDRQDAWVVRYDTATLQSVVPPMHKQSPPRQSGEVSAAARSPLPNTANRSSSEVVNPGLADSKEHSAPPPAKLMEYGVSFNEELYDYFGSSTVVAPQIDVSRNARKSPPKVESNGIVAERPNQNHSEQTRSEQTHSEQFQSEPMLPEHLRSEPKRVEPRHEPLQQASLRSHQLQQRLSAKNNSGDIFRLDRPSYTLETPDVSVEADDLSAATQSDLHQQALAKERDLRRATVRIFNPLWEVDRLEWPRVCMDLLEAIDDKTTGVATNLITACHDGLQILAVTSPQSGAGTSTVACCLAMLAGRHGLNVALVDCNAENPSLCYQTNLDLEVDWHEAVARKLPLEEIAVHSVEDQVTLVPLLARLSAPQINEHSMGRMLGELSHSFDLVVADLGHMGTQKSMVIKLGDSGVVHAVVAVVDRRNSSADQIESCLRQIRQSGIASIGLVENFAA